MVNIYVLSTKKHLLPPPTFTVHLPICQLKWGKKLEKKKKNEKKKVERNKEKVYKANFPHFFLIT